MNIFVFVLIVFMHIYLCLMRYYDKSRTFYQQFDFSILFLMWKEKSKSVNSEYFNNVLRANNKGWCFNR